MTNEFRWFCGVRRERSGVRSRSLEKAQVGPGGAKSRQASGCCRTGRSRPRSPASRWHGPPATRAGGCSPPHVAPRALRRRLILPVMVRLMRAAASQTSDSAAGSRLNGLRHVLVLADWLGPEGVRVAGGRESPIPSRSRTRRRRPCRTVVIASVHRHRGGPCEKPWRVLAPASCAALRPDGGSKPTPREGDCKDVQEQRARSSGGQGHAGEAGKWRPGDARGRQEVCVTDRRKILLRSAPAPPPAETGIGETTRPCRLREADPDARSVTPSSEVVHFSSSSRYPTTEASSRRRRSGRDLDAAAGCATTPCTRNIGS